MPLSSIGNLLTKMRTQLNFFSTGAKLLDSEGKPVHVLTTTLTEEYQFEPLPIWEDKITTWLDCFANSWAEIGGDRMAKSWTPIWIEHKLGAEPVRVWQYPMPLVTMEVITSPESGGYSIWGFWDHVNGAGTAPSCQSRSSELMILDQYKTSLALNGIIQSSRLVGCWLGPSCPRDLRTSLLSLIRPSIKIWVSIELSTLPWLYIFVIIVFFIWWFCYLE